ncbi:BZ3500_MvSof-1268-A1-R1_Chr2-1g04426 [Microbotryum saponariae]|uniref:BZ3500_MvSof-1268-A1-R1_Chr2-1g04425 protein n=1 Tax=Microbotryum saponariae TaxID=289078 RepID=A0A2X0MJ05_9BASI|nr:BZ3500_MvSof-1268-A1-R1_Chr2-1g04425 [Microbotryum saponariae]SCZ88462.1 BZ3500_MvSof-1268-A1-R1_Chr2-1g04426 [Microbotryum saponariae]SCZ91665.1 BZ3501_MvSof-1269-A2-R1_Chr2-1g04081 [Microbotryum saponariae]SCZ91667.1 BZ3501_MvSof-1269-A2-R1_Chr2-1g04082 [Microbotryum saponariae]
MFDWFNRKTQQVVEAVKTTWKFVAKPSTLLVILAQFYMGGFYYLET